MKLWLDAGNTRLKWQLRDDELLLAEGSYAHDRDIAAAIDYLYEQLDSQINARDKINFIALASVLNEEMKKNLLFELEQRFGLEAEVAKVSRKMRSVECAYRDFSKLGVDRWLAVVAAYEYFRVPVCVVDCGSALTVDVVNRKGRHLGGFILPGLNMSIKALLGQTQAVRFDTTSFTPGLEWGVNTAMAVQNGALLSSVGSVKEAWVRFSSMEGGGNNLSDARLVLTGGDAGFIASHLDVPFEQIEDLVLQGLRLAF